MISVRRIVALLLVAASTTSAFSALAQDQGAVDLMPVGDEGYKVMRHFFAYDANVPLDARTVEWKETPDYVREKIVFSGMLDGRVPGYLATPKVGSAPYPCVLLLHGLNSSKESWWVEQSTMEQLTLKLLRAGYAVLTLDAQFHGERSAENDFESPIALLEREWFVRSTDMIIQSVVEYRRALDYLADRSDIDSERIGAVGYSMGGIMTFILSAIESSVKAAVSCVSPIITAPYIPTGVHHHAPRIVDTPLLMLMANDDERNYTPEQARHLFGLVQSDEKELIFFESGHMLPAKWTEDAARWMITHL